jgi:L-amino acid N-acyltransferase YncA
VVRAIEAGDVAAVRDFFDRIPEGDRTFFREDVSRPGVIEGWVVDPRQHRLIAIVDGVVAGHVAIIVGVAWSSHVGEVRLVIDPAFRRRGVGRLLAQRAVVEAVEMGVTKLVVEVVAEQEATVAMFTALGFEAEGLLKDHVRTQNGQTRDLLVLSHFVEELWATMVTAGVDDALMD